MLFGCVRWSLSLHVPPRFLNFISGLCRYVAVTPQAIATASVRGAGASPNAAATPPVGTPTSGTMGGAAVVGAGEAVQAVQPTRDGPRSAEAVRARLADPADRGAEAELAVVGSAGREGVSSGLRSDKVSDSAGPGPSSAMPVSKGRV